jgi:hypothetical protein
MERTLLIDGKGYQVRGAGRHAATAFARSLERALREESWQLVVPRAPEYQGFWKLVGLSVRFGVVIGQGVTAISGYVATRRSIEKWRISHVRL